MIGIYKITSPNNKIYIGRSSNIEKRFKQYKSFNKSNNSQIKLIRSFNKYGIENHIFEIIEECDIELLNERERYYQEYYDCINPKKGLNCKLQGYGDNSGKMSEETKLKISKGNKGKIRTEEVKKKLSLIHIGKKVSQKTIESSRQRMLERKRYSGDIYCCISDKNGMSKKVICTQTLKIWNTIRECSEEIGIKYNLLSRYLNNNHPNKTTIIYLKNYE